MQSFLHNNRRFIPGPATDTKLQGYKSFMLDGVVFAYNLCTSFCTRCDFPGGSDSKVSAYNVVDPDSIPGLGRSSGDGNGNPLQYSCLDSPMEGGAWLATVHGVAKESDTTE